MRESRFVRGALAAIVAVVSSVVSACGGSAPSDLFDDGQRILPSVVDATAPDTSIEPALTEPDAGLADAVAPPRDAIAPTPPRDATPDRAPPPPPPPVSVFCGKTPTGSRECTRPLVCCHNTNVPNAPFSCTAENNCPGTPIECRLDADCASGETCCGKLLQNVWQSVTCEKTCAGTDFDYRPMCNPEVSTSVCPSAQMCRKSGVLTGFGYCL